MATRKDGGDGGGGLRVHCAGGRPWDYRSALAHLAAAGMSEAVAEHGLADASLERWCASKEPFECSGQSLFSALCRIIVYQQLAGAAASKIYGRFKDLFPGEPTPAMVKARGMEIQGVGLSRRKAEYILDLSEAMLDGRLRADEVGAMSNADLSAMLCSVRGIGQWSCDMFMMFQLKRSDVLPLGDLGIKKGLMKHFGMKKLPTEAQMKDLTAPWAPYRTLACYFLYKVLDTPTPTPDATPAKRKRKASPAKATVDVFAGGASGEERTSAAEHAEHATHADTPPRTPAARRRRRRH